MPKDIAQELTVLDGKCGGLLQLSGIILAIATIPLSTGRIEGIERGIALFIVLDFLLTSLLLLSVLWYVREPSERILSYRIRLYHISLSLVAFGLLAMAALLTRLL